MYIYLYIYIHVSYTYIWTNVKHRVNPQPDVCTGAALVGHRGPTVWRVV